MAARLAVHLASFRPAHPDQNAGTHSARAADYRHRRPHAVRSDAKHRQDRLERKIPPTTRPGASVTYGTWTFFARPPLISCTDGACPVSRSRRPTRPSRAGYFGDLIFRE